MTVKVIPGMPLVELFAQIRQESDEIVATMEHEMRDNRREHAATTALVRMLRLVILQLQETH